MLPFSNEESTAGFGALALPSGQERPVPIEYSLRSGYPIVTEDLANTEHPDPIIRRSATRF
jgi:hypothetical protein